MGWAPTRQGSEEKGQDMGAAQRIEGGGGDEGARHPHHAVQARRQLVRLCDDLQWRAKPLNCTQIRNEN